MDRGDLKPVYLVYTMCRDQFHVTKLKSVPSMVASTKGLNMFLC
jgi:hypothetical protein